MKKKRLMIGISVALGISALSGISAMAEEDEQGEQDLYERVVAIVTDNATDELWNTLAMTNDDAVETGVNIRDAVDGEVVACLYPGGAVEVLDKGDSWTEIQSGSVTGYIKNDFLVYGKDVKDLVERYGIPGVVAAWDDVKIFEKPDGDSTIVHTAMAGEKYKVVEDQGHWISILFGEKPDEFVAYVSEDDVIDVLLVGAAVPVDEDEPETEEYYEEEPSNDNNNSYENNYTPPATEAPPSTEEGDPNENVYVDDENITGGGDDVVEEIEGNVEEIVDGSAEYYEDDGEYAAETLPEETSGDYTEDYVDDTVPASEEDLLAALIYCEAGNQSYDGMVAVGAVVMNRVNSDSFPSTVSDVIYQDGQFTPAYSGALDSALANGVPSTCYDAAAAALNGENPVGDALYFNAGSGEGVQLGDHQFY